MSTSLSICRRDPRLSLEQMERERERESERESWGARDSLGRRISAVCGHTIESVLETQSQRPHVNRSSHASVVRETSLPHTHSRNPNVFGLVSKTALYRRAG